MSGPWSASCQVPRLLVKAVDAPDDAGNEDTVFVHGEQAVVQGGRVELIQDDGGNWAGCRESPGGPGAGEGSKVCRECQNFCAQGG